MLFVFTTGMNQLNLVQKINLKSVAKPKLAENVFSEDFCAKELCMIQDEPKPRKHVACNKGKKFGPLCPPKTKLIDFTSAEQKIILDMHNEVRNNIASGGHRLYNSARRMAFMQWNDTLAHVASFNVKTCDFKHDKCRNTRDFMYSGQNLAIRETTRRAKSRNEMMNHFTDLINIWILEGDRFCTQSFIDFYQPHPNPTFQIGHFTQMVREENPYVGCSAIEFSTGNMWSYLIACNYATSNFYGEKIYATGKGCSACLTGCHEQYNALCSENEFYHLN